MTLQTVLTQLGPMHVVVHLATQEMVEHAQVSALNLSVAEVLK